MSTYDSELTFQENMDITVSVETPVRLSQGLKAYTKNVQNNRIFPDKHQVNVIVSTAKI